MTISEDLPVGIDSDPVLAPPDLPPPDEDRRVVGELITEKVPGGPAEVTELTAEERADFAMLLTVGRRSKKIDVMGHAVVIQTLKSADEMRVGLFCKPYIDSYGFNRSYQVAVCAAGIREVDGRPLFSSLSENPDPDEIFDKCAAKVTEFYPVVVTQIYQAIMDLEKEFAELAIRLGKLKG